MFLFVCLCATTFICIIIHCLSFLLPPSPSPQTGLAGLQCLFQSFRWGQIRHIRYLIQFIVIQSCAPGGHQEEGPRVVVPREASSTLVKYFDLIKSAGFNMLSSKLLLYSPFLYLIGFYQLCIISCFARFLQRLWQHWIVNRTSSHTTDGVKQQTSQWIKTTKL